MAETSPLGVVASAGHTGAEGPVALGVALVGRLRRRSVGVGSVAGGSEKGK